MTKSFNFASASGAEVLDMNAVRKSKEVNMSGERPNMSFSKVDESIKLTQKGHLTLGSGSPVKGGISEECKMCGGHGDAGRHDSSTGSKLSGSERNESAQKKRRQSGRKDADAEFFHMTLLS